MSLNFHINDYFRLLVESNGAESRAIQMLVDDLHRDKQNTVNTLLSHCGSEDFLWALVRLLSSESARVAWNAAYILGTIAEDSEEEMGQSRILELINGPHPHKILVDLTDLLSSRDSEVAGNAAYILGTIAEEEMGQSRILELINGPHPHKILVGLTDLLSCGDSESVMNAAGTIGTLADTPEGREWILKDLSCDQMIKNVTNLFSSDDTWTSSNAALVLARISISEEGCQRMLSHTSSQKILTQLIASLGLDGAGRGMNAAFALGRLCDTHKGQECLLHHESLGCMMQSLCDMLTGTDPGCSKNSCYALSCLAGTEEGHRRLLNHKSSDTMIHLLSTHLVNKEGEVGWFAAMTLRTLASRQKGVASLRDHPDVIPQIKAVQAMQDLHADTRKEVNLTYKLLRPLDRPMPPSLEVEGANSIKVTWSEITMTTGQEVTYHLYCGILEPEDDDVYNRTMWRGKQLVPPHIYALERGPANIELG